MEILIVILLFLAVSFVVDGALAWILCAVLGAFGIVVNFWVCFGIIFLISVFTNSMKVRVN
jgi:hypothetical protein